MERFTFSVIVSNLNLDSDQQVDQLTWSAADIFPSESDGVVTLTIASIGDVSDRIDFVMRAKRFLSSVSPAIDVTQLAQDLVGLGDISYRTNIDREVLRTWANGERRAPRTFPPAIAVLAGGKKVWDWPTVLAWLKENGRFASTEIGLNRSEFAHLDSVLRNPRFAFAEHLFAVPQFSIDWSSLLESIPRVVGNLSGPALRPLGQIPSDLGASAANNVNDFIFSSLLESVDVSAIWTVTAQTPTPPTTSTTQDSFISAA